MSRKFCQKGTTMGLDIMSGIGSARATVFMFPGQGSQYFQMGRELYDKNHEFQKWMNRLNDLFKQVLSQSILNEIYDATKSKTEQFGNLSFSHPAIFMVEFSLAKALMAGGVKPDLVLGASLGELVAAAIAEVLSLEECVKLLVKQVAIYEEQCQRGGMLAVLDRSELFYEHSVFHEKSELASLNCPNHFVVSGSDSAIDDIQSFLKAQDIVFLRLPVSYPFHSSLMASVKPDLDSLFSGLYPAQPKIPFFSCARADFIKKFDRNYWWDVIRNPIRFSESILMLEELGNYTYLDVGPSGTLSTFAKYNLGSIRNSISLSVLGPFGDELRNFETLSDQLSTPKTKREAKEQDESMKVYVFPGQGSQNVGMGEGLFNEFPKEVALADNLLGYSIEDLCLRDPERRLSKTQYTQPALYVVNSLSYLKMLKGGGSRPSYLAGHSLGEYSALFAAGVFDFETGLKLVQRRGQLMSEMTYGGMGAVLKCDPSKIKRI